MPKLILLRHFKSQWNLENRFTGWVDVPLCKNNEESIREVAEKLARIKIDVVFTSPLIRNKISVVKALEKTEKYPIFIQEEGKMKKWGNFDGSTGSPQGENYIPVYVSEALNERYYGKLQGLNKEETMKKYGEELVHLWRRSFTVAPPEGESLAAVIKRTTPFYKSRIEKCLANGENVLVVASHNSLRALIKHIEGISDKDIINVEVPYAGLIEYEFSQKVYKKVN